MFWKNVWKVNKKGGIPVSQVLQIKTDFCGKNRPKNFERVRIKSRNQERTLQKGKADDLNLLWVAESGFFQRRHAHTEGIGVVADGIEFVAGTAQKHVEDTFLIN